MSKRPNPSPTEVIQPLRDLARNFDIDIEPYLQEYLHYESSLDNDVDGIINPSSSSCSTKTQFATAALKIQNSTSIYTRKVDFLHQVVYEAHEALSEYNTAGTFNRRKKKTEGADGDIDDFRSYDDRMEFLLLDDVLPVDRTGRKINLQTKTNNTVNNLNVTNAALNGTLNETTNNNNVTLLSLGGIMSTSRNDETFLISRESISNTSPAAMSRMLLQNLNTDTWRLIGTDVDGTGALVMPGAKKGVFVNGELMSPELMGAGDDEEQGEEVQIFPGGLTPNRQEEFVAGQEYDDGSFGGDDGGVGFELNDDPMEDEPVVEPEAQLNTDTKPENKKKVQDPWETCDPHQPSNDKPNPLKIGVTFRLPPGLDEEDIPSKSVTGSRTRNNVKPSRKAKTEEVTRNWGKSPFATDWLEETSNGGDNAATEMKTNIEWLSNVKKMIYGEEFAYLVKRYAKHFDALARQKRRQERVEDGNDQAVPEAPYNDDDYGTGFDYGGDDDYSYGNNDVEDQPEHHDQGRRSNVDFAAIDDIFTTAGFHDDGNDLDYNNSQLTFEELCRAHLRKFAKSAEIYAAETQLTKRVGAWQSGLAPILEEQEKRPEFDIHTVGRQILQSVEDKLSTRKRSATGEKKLDTTNEHNVGDGNIIGFRQLSKDKEEYEVCRLFLSTLMLCNCGNVLVHDGNDVGSTESLRIELLNAKFEEVMKEFLAPSVADENVYLDMSQEDD
jgi:condensin-2 complex subunit H2